MVECTGLENRNTRKRIVGSNPTLSARNKNGPERGRFYFWHRQAFFGRDNSNRHAMLDNEHMALSFRYTVMLPRAPGIQDSA